MNIISKAVPKLLLEIRASRCRYKEVILFAALRFIFDTILLCKSSSIPQGYEGPFVGLCFKILY